jgi:hypothetical protein
VRAACSDDPSPVAEEPTVDVPTDRLRVAARRWDAAGADLEEAARVVGGAPTWGFGEAADEVAALVAAVERALSGLAVDAERVVAGLFVTHRAVVDADEAVSASLAGLGPGAG